MFSFLTNRHGENQSMSWLPDLVASSKSDVGLLPVQCLCEFLLVHESESEKVRKLKVTYLQTTTITLVRLQNSYFLSTISAEI